MEFVGAALGHRVDRRADGLRRDVEVRGVDVPLFDRVHRHRRTEVRHAVGVEAEGIADVDRIHADVVVAAVLAHRRDRTRTAVGDDDARIETRDVLDRTVRRRHVLEVAAGDVRAQALVVGLKRRTRRDAGHGDALERLRAGARDGEVQRRLFGELEVDVVLVGGFAVVARGLDLERTADAQALRGIAAVRIGENRARRARGDVDDFDGGARDRLAGGVDDAAAQGRRRVLSICGGDGQQGADHHRQ
jgi:hypothetical protein